MKDKEKDICMLFEKALKVLKAYTRKSPVYSKTIKEIKREISDGFENSIKLNIKDLEVLQNDIPMYIKSKKEDNVFFPLYRDGIREIGIDPNISEEELDKFIEVLNFDSAKDSEDLDTVGYLWQKDLNFLSYKAIDGIGENPQVGEKGDEFSKIVEETLKGLKERPPFYNVKDSKYKMVIDKDIKIDKLYVENMETEKVPFEEDYLIFLLSQEEANYIREIVSKLELDENQLIFKFLRILFYLLKKKKYKSKDDLNFYFEKFAESFLKIKDFSNYFWLLENLEEIKEMDIFNNLIYFLNLEYAKEILEDSNRERYLRYFLKILIYYFPDFLIKFWGNIPKHFILEELNNNPQIIEKFLMDEEKAYFILSIAPKELLFIFLDKIKKFLYSQNERLKEKAFEILVSNISYIGIKDFLIFLEDENQNIRIKFLKAVEDEDLKNYVIYFTRLIDDKRFDNLNFLEKKLILKIILKNSKKEERYKINNLLPKGKFFISKNKKKKAIDVANILNQFEEGKIFLKENEKIWKKYLKGAKYG